MRKVTFILGMVAAAAAFTGCEEPLACEEGNKAILTVYNNTLCTPMIEANGDDMVEIEALGSAVIELDAGTYDIYADLALITACVEADTTIETVCGGEYTWTFE